MVVHPQMALEMLAIIHHRINGLRCNGQCLHFSSFFQAFDTSASAINKKSKVIFMQGGLSCDLSAELQFGLIHMIDAVFGNRLMSVKFGAIFRLGTIILRLLHSTRDYMPKWC